MGRLIKASSKKQKASRQKAITNKRQYESQKNAINKIRNLIRNIFLRNILRRKLVNMRNAKFHANIKISTSIQQVDKHQDFVISGKTDEFSFIVVADGHGGNKTIETIRKMNWGKILSSLDFSDSIYQKIKALGNTDNDGATLTIVKIFPTHVDICLVGDSSARVYKNGAEIFRTKDHDMYNQDEMERIKKKNIPLCETVRLCAKTPQIIQQIESCYFEFRGFGNKLNVSHSFGHNGVTGEFMSHERIPVTYGDTYNVIVGSDGFWDMICDEDNLLLSSDTVNSDMLLELALMRWNKKDWNFERQCISPKYPADTREKIGLGLGDDVCVAVATF